MDTIYFLWAEKDSNLRTLARTDLQSVAFNHSAIYPTKNKRADGGIRTPDPLITNQLLWPTELHRQLNLFIFKNLNKKNYNSFYFRSANIQLIFDF